MRVTRETSPEAIDKLQRRKLELEVEIHALEREKDAASKERLQLARKAIGDVEDRLQPLKAAYENEKKRGDEITNVRRKMDELKAKADEAERRCVFSFDSVPRAYLELTIIHNIDTISPLRRTCDTLPSPTSNTDSNS